MLVFPLIYGPNYSFSETGVIQYPNIVVIPNSVKSLTASTAAFQSHTEIERIVFEDNSPITVFPASCFEGCTGLASIENLPENLKTSDSCFKNCISLEDIILPESLTSLGNCCFQNCQILEKVDIPANITTIPSYCFSQCVNLERLNIKGTITTLRQYCFEECTNLTNEFVEEIIQNVKTYENGIFRHCHNLKELTLPHITGYMFQECDNLQKVTITNNLTVNVGAQAFAKCPKLETIIFTEDSLYTSINHVDKYGIGVFQNCVSLKNVQLPRTLITLGSRAFQGCKALEILELPKTITSIGQYCFYDCSSLEKIVLSEKVTTIPSYAFYNCNNLKEINLENVNTLSSYCFQNAFAPITFTIPGNITTIGANSFSGCKLVKIILEEGITSLASNSFNSCLNLTTINLPNTLTTIEQGVFKGCTNLKILEIPDSVTSLGKEVIANSGIETLYLGLRVATIDENAFKNANELKNIYFNKVKGSISVPTNIWGAPVPANITLHWLTSNWTFSSNVDLSQAKIFIEGNEVKNLYYESENVGEVEFKAYHPDYLSLSGTIILSPPEDQILDLQFTDQTGIIFTIIPNVENCNITITYNNCTFNSDHAMVEPGTELSYTIQKDGYVSQSGTLTLNENYNLVVELVLEGSEI